MVNETTGFSAYEMVYGKTGRGSLEVLRGTWGGENSEFLKLNKTSRRIFMQINRGFVSL